MSVDRGRQDELTISLSAAAVSCSSRDRIQLEHADEYGPPCGDGLNEEIVEGLEQAPTYCWTKVAKAVITLGFGEQSLSGRTLIAEFLRSPPRSKCFQSLLHLCLAVEIAPMHSSATHLWDSYDA